MLLSTFAARNFDFFINFHLNFNNMRKTYQMILALALLMLGVTNAMGQKIYRAELDKSMFKAWDSNLPGANVVANPENEPKENHAFACAFDLYKTVEQGGMIYGSGNVYYLWYADLTGTKKMYVKGTPGMKIRLMLNREAPADGVGDADGGNYVEIVKDIPESGEVVFDFTAEEKLAQYIHLNAIKVPYGSSSGVVTAIDIEGTVKPVTGILSMINNGDAEGDDLSSFPVSWDGPNNDNTASDLPEIVEGAGVNGSRCLKVTSYPTPTESWQTQFYIKADEVMPKGTKWKLSMWVKADNNCRITTSSQGLPRDYKSGNFVPAFDVTTQWEQHTWNGEIGDDGFQSIAFDLNNGEDGAGNGNCGFYFDNIEFGADLGGSNPMSDVTLARGADVVCIDFADKTNLKDLVKAKGIEISGYDENGDPIKMKTLVFDNSCATVTWNGNVCNITSIEGREDGNLYVFLEDTGIAGEEPNFDDEAAVVAVAFVNPTDNDYHLTFTTGKWQGQDVPNFDGLTCIYKEELGTGTIFSYLWGSPEVVEAIPEKGSFNLDPATKEFKMTFNQRVDASTVVAKLGNEPLTVSPAEGFVKTVTLTRTGTADLNGVKKLTITAVKGEKAEDATLDEPIVISYSFGQTQFSDNDQPAVVYESNFADNGEANALGAGWIVNADAGGMQPANSGSGCRLMHNQGAFLEDLLYISQRSTPNVPGGIALYGTEADNKLSLDGGKKYKLTLGACQHDKDGVALLVQVLPEEAVNAEDGSVNDESQILIQEKKTITVTKVSKEVIRFDLDFTTPTDGNYVLRFVANKADGTSGGYDGCVVFGDVKVEYIPNVMGLLEMKALETALTDAKKIREENSGDRYAGEAYTNLDNLIKEYDCKTMTAPSAYNTAVSELEDAVKTMSNHRSLCDNFDKLAAEAQAIVDANADKKFAATEVYATLSATAAKYILSKETVVEGEGDEQTTKVVYEFKKLTDDTELEAAITELTAIVNTAKGMFTEGASKAMTTGAAALTERIRTGAETLKKLGVDSTDGLIVAANNAISDDDALAENIQNRIKKELYGQLKNADNTLFKPTFNEETEETVVPTYDMTAFIKNPNFYMTSLDTHDFSSENIPGWTFTFSGNAYLDASWGGVGTYAPVDITLCNWNGSFNGSQTIENLPAGVYTLKSGFMERNGDDENAKTADSYIFARTTTNYVADDPDLTGAKAFVNVFGQQDWNMTDNLVLEGIVVTDGKLTIGVNADAASHLFVNQMSLWLTAPATGFDYASAYETEAAGIETLEGTPAVKVRGIQLFDLNGRRLSKAQKGVTIVKKVMSDGSIQTEKVIVK